MSTPLNVIIGLGKTGLSCVEFCLRQGWPVAVTDSRLHPSCEEELKRLVPNIKTVFGGISETLLNQASQLIISPGVSLKEPAIEKVIRQGIPYCGDVQLFANQVSSPIIAITGTNAKSTVTALVGEMAKAAGINAMVAGNIGTPVLDLLKQSLADLYVLELSSFQLETTEHLKTKVSALLNVTEDHMDRYESMEEYRGAKQRIYRYCEVAVFNREEAYTYPKEKVSASISFGLSKPQENQYGLIKREGEVFLARGENILLNIQEIKLPGQHNVENALAALAIAEAANINTETAVNVLKTFAGLPHRCQLIRERQGVKWYNDSKGTNVGATVAALKGLGSVKNIVLLAGGVGKDADFSPLQEPVNRFVKKAIFFGQSAEALESILKTVTDVSRVSTFEEAIVLADKQSKSGDVVLLSPACASFDMFNDYKHRGAVFETLVRELK